VGRKERRRTRKKQKENKKRKTPDEKFTALSRRKPRGDESRIAGAD